MPRLPLSVDSTLGTKKREKGDEDVEKKEEGREDGLIHLASPSLSLRTKDQRANGRETFAQTLYVSISCCMRTTPAQSTPL